jgi:uncharacterized membrane protein YeaQ/YmgE (transglycosylase-associated protein family)
MNIFHIIWMLVIGLVVGMIARLLLPGAQHMGLFLTAIAGIVGSFVGGFLGTLIKKPAPDEKFHPAGILMSILGTVLVLFIAEKLFPNM